MKTCEEYESYWHLAWDTPGLTPAHRCQQVLVFSGPLHRVKVGSSHGGDIHKRCDLPRSCSGNVSGISRQKMKKYLGQGLLVKDVREPSLIQEVLARKIRKPWLGASHTCAHAMPYNHQEIVVEKPSARFRVASDIPDIP